MIYFIQDSGTLFIKIGFTEGTAADRLKQLQTGCPGGLHVIHAREGTQAQERELHQKFIAARERGEWFRPVPELLAAVVQNSKAIGYAEGWSDQQEQSKIDNQRKKSGPTFAVYLAGKISQQCWRHQVISDLGTDHGSNLDGWPILKEAIFGVHDYVGPFFPSTGHGNVTRR